MTSHPHTDTITNQPDSPDPEGPICFDTVFQWIRHYARRIIDQTEELEAKKELFADQSQVDHAFFPIKHHTMRLQQTVKLAEADIKKRISLKINEETTP